MSGKKLMSSKDVEEYLGGKVTAATLAWWRHVNDGRGPRWGRLGHRKVVYRKTDVDAWLDSQYAAN